MIRRKTPKLLLTSLLVVALLATAMTAQGTTDPADTTTVAFTQAKSDTIKKNRTDACEGYTIDFTLKSEADMDKLRTQHSNQFVSTVDILLDVYKGREFMKLLNVKLLILIVILLLFIIVVFSWIMFIINMCLCCCNDSGKDKECCIKCNLFIAFVGLLGFAACCVALAYYAPNVRSGMGKVFCALTAVSDDIVNGSTNPSFVGTFPLASIFSSYVVDFDKLRATHTQNFNDIANLNLKALSTQAYDAIDPFNVEFKDKKTKDAEGTEAVPISIKDVLPALITGAKQEFDILKTTCTQVHDAAAVGKEQVNNPQFDDVKTNITDVVSQVDGISNTIHDTFDTIISSYNMIDKNYNLGQIAFLVFCFVCLLIALLIFIGLCCYLKKNKCDCPCCCRMIIAILGLFILLFTIFSFIIGVVAFTTSASCGILKDMGKKEGIDKFVDLFQLQGQMVDILNTCMLEGGNGQLSAVFSAQTGGADPTAMFDDLEQLLGVFDQYEETYNQVKGRTSSLAFEEFNKAVVKIRDGVGAVDHTNVVAAIAQLDLFLSCDSKEMVMTDAACTARTDTTKTCVVIDTASSFTNPGCNTDSSLPPNPADIFTKLKTYNTETKALINLMDDKGFLKVQETPNKKYSVTLTAFDTAVTKFNLIKADMTKTIDLLKSAETVTQSDCKILRSEIQSLESSMCFDFVPAIYNFMLVALVGTIFFLSFIWHFCCADCCLRMSRNHGDEAEKNTREDNIHNYVGVTGGDYKA